MREFELKRSFYGLTYNCALAPARVLFLKPPQIRNLQIKSVGLRTLDSQKVTSCVLSAFLEPEELCAASPTLKRPPKASGRP